MVVLCLAVACPKSRDVRAANFEHMGRMNGEYFRSGQHEARASADCDRERTEDQGRDAGQDSDCRSVYRRIHKVHQLVE